MWFTIAAMVELFPDPVAPVTSIRPRSAAAIVGRIAGSLRVSNVGTSKGMTRITIMKDERCRRRFTRKRPTPGTEHVPRLDVEVGGAAIDRGLDDLLDPAWLGHRTARATALRFLLH